MRRLVGAIPRAYKDHRRRAAQTYGRSVRAITARHPNLGPEARPWLREYGVVTVDLEQLHQESQSPRLSLLARARLRRQGMKLRGQLLLLERRLEELAQRNGHATGLAAALRESPS